MEITIRLIDANHGKDINIPNEPFDVMGKLILEYRNENWNYKIIKYPQKECYTMTFPNENYNYADMVSNGFSVGAYAKDGKCIGLAIFQKTYNKFLYLLDLKVNANYRNYGIGTLLIEEGKKIAKENNYIGLYTQAQDNNVIACKFYLKTGFVIGGMDTMLYKGTKQEGKSDIIFYLEN